MNAHEQFRAMLADCPLIAILRGVTPDEVEAIGEALYESGIRIMEVPLNSPDPLASIARLSALMGDRAMVGAGTVLGVRQVADVGAAGGRLVVSPSTNAEVIRATIAAGMASCPGFFTPSEAFRAIESGADALKFFPAEAAHPAVLRAQRTVLPKGIPLLVVGGLTPDTMAQWREAGADGFGLGSGIYRPGQTAAETRVKARSYVEALGSR